MQGKKVLIIDDSVTERTIALKALEGKGFEIVIAVNGEEGLETAIREKPDLVMLDVVMPGKNGFQVCRSIKTTDATKHAKVLLLSTKNQASDKFWAMKQGADDYLVKPYAETDLLAAIAKLL